MKTKLLLAAALVGAVGLSSAQAGVRFGFSFGLPLPVPVVAIAPPAPVLVTAPPCYAPGVVVTAPACPGPDYVWVPGYWNVVGHSRAWVAGSWSHRPAHMVYEHRYDRGGYRR